MKNASTQAELAPVFRAARRVLRPYDAKLHLRKDGPGDYLSESKSIRYQGKPVMFSAITSKSYVSVHLFPVYMFPDLAHDISPALHQRRQGKACWNFKKVDPELFLELGELVDAAFRRFAQFGDREFTRAEMQTLSSKK